MKRYRLIAVLILMAGSAYAVTNTTFTGRLVLSPDWKHNKTGGSSTLKETFSAFLDWTHTTGTNANQMGTIIVDSYTLTNSESRTIDLDSIANGFGDTIDFLTVRFMAISCDSDNVDPVTMGDAAANEFDSWCGGTNQTVTIRPGGIILFVAPDLTGYAVGTDGNLKISNTGTNNASYDLYIGGNE